MKFNLYFLFARLTPALICSVPFFVLYFFFLNPLLGPFLTSLFALKPLGDISVSAAFIVLLTMTGRSVSKDVFERVLFRSDMTRMPGVDFLLHFGTEYTPNFKAKIHEKINSDFGIQILTANAELKDEMAARKVIAEAVSLVRHKIKDGRLLLQHNMEYGFFRNLIGCSVIAVVISLINVWVFSVVAPDSLALPVSIVTTIAYAIPILLSGILMKTHGKRYARILFQEYYSS